MPYHWTHDEKTATHHAYHGRFNAAGEATQRHAHDRGHMARVSAGSAIVDLEGRNGLIVVQAGGEAYVPARKKHLLRALEPGTVTSCVFERFDDHGNEYADPRESTRCYAEGLA